MPTTLQDLLSRYKERYGSLRALGHAIGLSPSRMSRLARGDEQGSLDVINCLKLAEVTGASPTRILRAAGKGEVAALIETLYKSEGREATMPALPPDQAEVIALWTSLPPQHRAAALESLRYVVQLAAEEQQLEHRVAALVAEVHRLESLLPAVPFVPAGSAPETTRDRPRRRAR